MSSPTSGTASTQPAAPGDPLHRWCAALDDAYPPADAEGWDPVGLHVGDRATDVVHGVLVALDVTPATLDEAEQVGADLIVVHHPLIFSGLARLDGRTAASRLALRAARQGCAILAAHTNVDKAAAGTSHPAATVLGLTDLHPIQPLDDTHDAQRATDTPGAPAAGTVARGIGLIGSLSAPTPLRQIAALLAEGLPAPHLRLAAVDGDVDRQARTVAICGGAGDSYIPGLIGPDGPRVDVYVTGDLKHHPTTDALTMGLSLIDAGHYPTENPAMDDVLAQLVARRDAHHLTAPIHRSTVNTDPWTPWRSTR